MNTEERVAKLGALLARVSERAKVPRPPRAPETRTHTANGLEDGASANLAGAGQATSDSDAAEPVTKQVVLSQAIGRAAMPGDEPLAMPQPSAASATPTAIEEHVEVEVTEVEVDDEEAISAAEAASAAEGARVEELPSRERMVAASPVSPLAGHHLSPPAAEVPQREAERPPTFEASETGERLAARGVGMEEPDADTEVPPNVDVTDIGEASGVATADDVEPPASSRRPIALEPKLEELAFGDAAPTEEPHAPPPESGRQVAAAPVELDFESEFTGVRPRDSEPASAPVERRSERPAAALEAAAAAAADSVETTAPRAADAARAPVFTGAAPTFKPSSFGALLDATLSL
jgi:hypothetical protein